MSERDKKLLLDEVNDMLNSDAAISQVDNDFLKAIVSTISILEARIEELENPWVSVDERLPEHDVPVLVSWGRGDITPMCRYVEDGEGWYWNALDAHHHEMTDPEEYTESDDYNPKYWRPMPLPPIPKEPEL